MSSWVLYIDADERLVLPTGQRLASQLENPKAIAARVNFRPILRGTRCREYRVFRSRPDIRFVGAIHETIMPALERLFSEVGAPIIDIDAELVHLGYEGDLTHKFRRNLPMLKRMAKEWPDRLYYWLDLAKALRGVNENQEALKACIEGLRRAQHQTSPGSRSIAAQIALNYAQLLMEEGKDARATIHQGLDFYPNNPMLQFQLAAMDIKDGRYAEAIVILDALIKTGPDGFRDPISSVDERLFGAYALEAKSLALLRLGRRAEAAECMRQASILEPAEASYRVKAIALGAR